MWPRAKYTESLPYYTAKPEQFVHKCNGCKRVVPTRPDCTDPVSHVCGGPNTSSITFKNGIFMCKEEQELLLKEAQL